MLHVIPTNDTFPHNEAKDCWCKPVISEMHDDVLIHNSYDEREHFEEYKNDTDNQN